MNAHAQTSVAAHYEDVPSARDVQVELEETKLGSALLALLTLAQDIDLKAAKREGEHVQNGRRYLFKSRPEERLAEQLLNLLGPPEDCFFVRDLAEGIAQ